MHKTELIKEKKKVYGSTQETMIFKRNTVRDMWKYPLF